MHPLELDVGVKGSQTLDKKLLATSQETILKAQYLEGTNIVIEGGGPAGLPLVIALGSSASRLFSWHR